MWEENTSVEVIINITKRDKKSSWEKILKRLKKKEGFCRSIK